MNNVESLIVSSSIDFSTDLISCELEKRGLCYLRLNRDQFFDYEIIYSLSDDELIVVADEHKYFISSFLLDRTDLRNVYVKCISKNRMQNIIRNNGIYTSYECIRNAFVCLFFILSVIIFPMS